jgi:ribosomal protein S18 acetylase RimI-like enzyme
MRRSERNVAIPGQARSASCRATRYDGPVTEEVSIRRAESADLPRLASLAGELVRMHHAVDPARFLLVDDVEEGYGWWFSRELARAEALVFVACAGAPVIGYAYGAIQGRDWNLLLDTHGAVHDVFVAQDARRRGVGRKLVGALVTGLEGLGAKRIVLSTMTGNEAAQRLFRECGFRPTMLEMTL